MPFTRRLSRNHQLKELLREFIRGCSRRVKCVLFFRGGGHINIKKERSRSVFPPSASPFLRNLTTTLQTILDFTGSLVETHHSFCNQKPSAAVTDLSSCVTKMSLLCAHFAGVPPPILDLRPMILDLCQAAFRDNKRGGHGGI